MLKAREGFEPSNKGFAVLSMLLLARKFYLIVLWFVRFRMHPLQLGEVNGHSLNLNPKHSRRYAYAGGRAVVRRR